MKNMKGGKCCKCAGGRGKWGTSCYDDPSNCCKKTKTAKDMLKASADAKKRYNNRKKTKKNSKKSWLSFF
jgi:hypothetical protein